LRRRAKQRFGFRNDEPSASTRMAAKKLRMGHVQIGGPD
jgi:hypothetical protein